MRRSRRSGSGLLLQPLARHGDGRLERAHPPPLALSEGAIDDFLPTTLGYWGGELYSVGFWEAAKAIYARKSDLEKYGLRTPTVEEPWTGEEFDEVLKAYKDSGWFHFR